MHAIHARASTSAHKRSAHEAGLADRPAKRPAPCNPASGSNAMPLGSDSSTVSEPQHLSNASKRTLRDRERQKQRKQEKKDATFSASGQAPRPKHAKKLLTSNVARPLKTAVDFDAFPVASSGYEALNKGSTVSSASRTLKDALASGLEYVDWDGIGPLLLTDPVSDAICLAGAGRNASAEATESQKAAGLAILNAGAAANFPAKKLVHKRGKDFGALNTGILWGQGPTEPYNLNNGRYNQLLEDLKANPDIIRLATFQSSALNMFFPQLYKRYHCLRADVERHMKDLKWNFQRSVFSAAAFNFGPRTVTTPHRDSMNLPAGFCAIHALGEYDADLGGHLIVEELGVVIRFPPGSCILIPSAILTHSNTAIQEDEWRVSFTQFSSGALFRYADNGYRTEQEFKEYDEVSYNFMMGRKATRWERDLENWSTFEDVLSAAGLEVEEDTNEENGKS
ncbi:hypothetical protein DFP72DRAFT_597917 [Ephemerocybe angulata]|uniref:Uncharacterized protein n=1 Tax=Ephemerocybe angulata TaxID=980116 RepID=A0A8H6MFG7_9AGAR|nr:hypothetical protein DFP72DRAFT_597917 [Tulosesus angulatus]